MIRFFLEEIIAKETYGDHIVEDAFNFASPRRKRGKDERAEATDVQGSD
jgi:hypothetical protein